MRFYDRESEINPMVFNGFDRTGMAVEIKCNPRKISLKDLQKKVDELPSKTFGEYTLSLKGLSIEDM